MRISDEQIAACLDGELSAEDRTAVTAAVAADPELARRFAAQRALRDRVRRAFDRTLQESVPPRLLNAVRSSAVASPERSEAISRRRALRATVWLAAAASIVLAVLALPRLMRLPWGEPDIVTSGASSVASGELARTLTRRLASEPSSGNVRIGLSFVAKSGEYCRTFVATEPGSAVAGLACREPDSWRIDLLEPVSGSVSGQGEYRQAASALPPHLLAAVQARIADEPLDAAGEARARASGWRRRAD